MNTSHAENAIAELRQTLGAQQVSTEERDIAEATSDTSPMRHSLTAIVRPQSEDDVGHIIAIANRFAIPVYPVSSGNNWGYGTSNPVRDGCILVDLSGMDQVLEFDAELGLVTLQPGVTQAKLGRYLEDNDLDFLIPVTGAGPSCSLIGNTLERGYGITPIADHFAAMTRVRAILADGSLYDSALSELGGKRIDRAFKYGIGPYVDGLFTQGNIGIVTSMTIALARRPEKVVGFFFGIPRDEGLEEAVRAVQRILRQTQGTTGSINLMNQRRVLAMMEPYPEGIPAGELIPDAQVTSMAKRNQVMTWTGAGAIYGNRDMIRAAKRIIRRELRGTAKRLMFFTPDMTYTISAASRFLPGRLGSFVGNIFATLDKTLALLAGRPSEIALPLCYWKSGTPPAAGRDFDPARDGTGLYWYSPLVPMVPEAAREYTSMVDSTCRQHGIEPLITLTSVSERCWDSTVPILFDPLNDEDSTRAKKCYRDLFENGRQLGYVPYRSHVETMDWYVSADSPFWRTTQKIKQALDPNGILAPGRYSP
ncbi:MAG: FAD-binding oxidoreductase [Gammaproteobacteria bacterium]|nr:FAD-binding oxidoreductase [Gammaproteobacteria bacterium]